MQGHSLSGMRLFMVLLVALGSGIRPGLRRAAGQSTEPAQSPGSGGGATQARAPSKMRSITQAQRKAAAARAAAQRSAPVRSTTPVPQLQPAPSAAAATPNYFGMIPNYANSPLPTVIGSVLTP